MSATGSPHFPTDVAFQPFLELTPIRDLDDDDDEPAKTECNLLKHQAWGGKEEIVEQKRRQRIHDKRYWEVDLLWKLNMVASRILEADLGQLLKTTQNLDKVFQDLGISPHDIEKARFEQSAMQKEYWDTELEFRQGLQHETEQPNYSNEEDQPAPATHTSKLGPVPAPRFNSHCPPTARVKGARVQKTTRRSTRATQQQSLSARAEEPSTAASPKPSLSKSTTTISRTRRNKTLVGNLRDSTDVQNPKKPTSPRKYNLRSRDASIA